MMKRIRGLRKSTSFRPLSDLDDRFYHYPPLPLFFRFGITNKNGSLTLANITAIMNPDHWKALWLSLGLSLVSTILCLILAYPLAMILRGRGSSASGFIVFIFILPMWMNFFTAYYGMADIT